MDTANTFSPLLTPRDHVFGCAHCLIFVTLINLFLLGVLDDPTPFSVSCNANLKVENSLNFCTSEKIFIYPSYLKVYP